MEDGMGAELTHFPVHARCVTHDAGYPGERDRARRHLVIGQVYTVREMYVRTSSTVLEFYEIRGRRWSAELFEPVAPDGTPYRPAPGG